MIRAALVLGCALLTIVGGVQAQATEVGAIPLDSTLAMLALPAAPPPAAERRDSVIPAKDAGLAGAGFLGALAWYPGALAGLSAGAGRGGGSGLRREHRFISAVVAGGGASTGLVVGVLVTRKRRCDPVRTTGLAVLGGEIGSFAGAAVTGTFGLFSKDGIALAAAPVVIPAASALMAIAFVRHCHQGA